MQKQQTYNDLDELMQGFCLGREDAFSEIFRKLYPALCYYGFKITGQKAVSEDIAGESFIKIWQRRADFHSFPELKSFLYRTVKNASVDWIRKSRTGAKALQGMGALAEHVEDHGITPLVMTETYRQLYAAIEELPTQCRKVITLSYLHGKTGLEVSAALNMNPATVRSHKNRGISLLRKRLRYFLHFHF